MRRFQRASVFAIAMTIAAAAAGCGGSGGESAKDGGTLTVLNQGDFQYLDPGASYYQFDYMVDYATQRPLYSYKPNDTSKTPDLAAAQPEISKDNRTVTVKLRHGVRFSPPVSREVTSADVKYAIERAFSANVPNAYVSTYMPLKGAPAKPTPGVKPIAGILTPDRYTVRFELTKPTGSFFAEALALPASAPVPPEYARKFDERNPSRYDVHQVATGPYMIQNDKSGKLTGYTADRQVVIVRNPNWSKALDYRPAHVSKIVIEEGNSDTGTATRKIFTGSHLINGDITPPGASLREGTTRFKHQLVAPYSGSYRFVALNIKKPPFTDINVRKAVIAGMDRTTLRQARGGPTVGDVAYHFIPTEFPGFEESGGASSSFDFMASPKANPAVSAKYFKAAGFPSGRYTGRHKDLTLTCDNADPGKSVCVVTADALRGMGFNPRIQSVPHEKAISICGIPAKEPEVCPNLGWVKDFNDPQTLLETTFSGRAILPENNSNYSQLDDPQINAMFAKAATVRDRPARLKAFAAINRVVVAKAVAIPYLWEKQPNAESPDVAGEVSKFNAVWDLSFTGLK